MQILEQTNKRGSILPKGDRWSPPPGRRQFRLAGLVWLLTIEAVAMSIARMAGLGTSETILVLCLVIAIWWRYAEIRFPVPPPDTTDDEALREEIRRWRRVDESRSGSRR